MAALHSVPALLVLVLAGLCHAGTLSGTITLPNTSQPLKGGVLSLKLSQVTYKAGTGLIVPQTINCGTTIDGSVVGAPDPLVGPVVTADTISGSLPNATYYVVFAYNVSGAETRYSPETVVLLSGAGELTINSPALQPVGATYDVFIGTSSGTETRQAQGVAFGTNYVQNVPLVAGAALPTSNTTVCTLAFTDEMIPTGTWYAANLVTSSGSQIPGFPQRWQMYGGAAANINISNGFPIASNITVFPTPIVANPLNNATQSINGPLSLGTYGLTAGQLSVCSLFGMLEVGSSCYPNLSSAMTAALNGTSGGVVQTPVHYRETITSSIDIGSSTQPITVECGTDTVFTIATSNAAADVFPVHNASGFTGINAGSAGSGRTGGCSFVVNSGASFRYLINTPEGMAGQPGQAYLTLNNIFVTGNATSTCTAMINLEGLNNLNDSHNIHIDTFPCIGIRIASNASNVTGPIQLLNDEVNGVYVAGARPLVVTAGTHTLLGVNVIGGDYVHPGSGLACIEFNGNGTAQVLKGIKLATYVENLQNGNSKVIKLVDTQDASIENTVGLVQTTDTLIDISESAANLSANIKVDAVGVYSTGNAAPLIVNHISNETVGGVHSATYYWGGEVPASIKPFSVSGAPFQVLDPAGTILLSIPLQGSSTNHVLVRRFVASKGSALVSGDFALSGGWGASGSIGSLSGTDQAWTGTVTSAGAGQGANPTITLTFHDGAWPASPICNTKIQATNDAVPGTLQNPIQDAPSGTQNVITYMGTPVVNKTYTFSSQCIGR